MRFVLTVIKRGPSLDALVPQYRDLRESVSPFRVAPLPVWRPQGFLARYRGGATVGSAKNAELNNIKNYDVAASITPSTGSTRILSIR